VLITDTKDELFPKLYRTQLWLIVPAPLLVALNDIPIARSASVMVIAAGIKILCRNKLLPNPAVPVTVPIAVAIGPPMSCKLIFCVKDTFDANKLPLPDVRIVTVGPPPAVLKLIPAPDAIDKVPVTDAAPIKLTAFSPLIDIVIAPAAVAVCRLMFGPAARARDNALPAIDVPDAEMVLLPPAPPVGPMIVIPPAEEDNVMLLPAASRICPEAVVVVPLVAPPAVMDEIPKPFTTLPVVEIVIVDPF
jgi:hypothetical protein